MEWGLATVVVGSALAIGSVYTEVLCVVAAALVAVLVASWWGAKPTRARLPATLVLAVGVGLVAWSALQLLPLPKGLLEAIAPANAEIWDRALTPLREAGPAHPPISLDPNATRIAILRGVVLVLAFLCALRVAARREGVRFLERVLLVSSLVVGVAAVVHPALGLTRVFGVFKPESVDFGTRLAPLLNSNHLSAYLNIGSCIALAMALARSSRIPRIVPATAFILLVATQIWVASRGGVAAMLLGCVLVLWLARRSDKEGRALPWKLILPGALVVASAGALVLAMKAQALSELTSRDTVKIQTIKRSFAVLSEFRWVGMGRGAFESVFPAFRTDGEGNIAFTHPESIGLQWATEWGAPIALVALVVLAFALRPRNALARTTVPVGPAAAIVALFVHNLLDFNLEIPGVAIAVAVCAACVVGGEAEVDRDAEPAWWTRSPRALVGASGAVTLLVIIAAWSGRHHELVDDQRSLRVLALAKGTDETTFERAAREAMLRHPADPYLPMMGGVRAAKTRDGKSIPWLAKAIERASVYGRAHLLLARQLARRSPSQARMEYRLAMEQDYNLIEPSVNEGAKLVKTPYDALQLIPGGGHTDTVIPLLATRLRETVPAAAERLDEELAARDPDSAPLARAAVEKALESLRARRPPCDSDPGTCAATVERRLNQLRRVAPRECATHRYAAELGILRDDRTRALAELERAIESVTDPGPCLRFLVEQARAMKDTERVQKGLERLVGTSCTTDAECSAAHLFAVESETAIGDNQRALRYAKRGLDRMPDDLDLMSAVARISAASGLHVEALALYRKLLRRDPGNAAYREAIRQEEAAMDGVRGRALGIER